MNYIDTTNAQRILADVPTLLENLNATVIDHRTSRTEAAAVTRDLLYIADTLERAAAEVRAQYWAAKDYPDPLART